MYECLVLKRWKSNKMYTLLLINIKLRLSIFYKVNSYVFFLNFLSYGCTWLKFCIFDSWKMSNLFQKIIDLCWWWCLLGPIMCGWNIGWCVWGDCLSDGLFSVNPTSIYERLDTKHGSLLIHFVVNSKAQEHNMFSKLATSFNHI